MGFAPLGRDVSRLVLGTLVVSTDVLDEYVRLGGNAIDTAHAYNDGDSERALGAWMDSRPGVRERLTIISKGAHPSADRRRVTPEDITCDLRDTLARLGTSGRPVPAAPRRPVGAGRPDRRGPQRAPRGRAPARLRRVQLDLRADRGGERVRARPRPRGLLLQQRPPVARDAERGALAGHAVGLRRRDRRLARAHADAAVRVVGAGARLLRRARRRARLRQRRPTASGCGAPSWSPSASASTANQVALAWVLHQPFPVYAIFGVRTVESLHEAVRRARRRADRGRAALAQPRAGGDQGVTAPRMKSMIA